MRRVPPELERLWTVMDLITWGVEFFKAKDVDSPRLTMELMLCHVLHCTRLQLYTNFEQPLSKDELATLRGMVQRRVRHEPLQYILGTADFYGLSFHVEPDVLIPRPETEILVERAIRFLKTLPEPTRALDIGTGTACIPLACLHHLPTTQWTAVDRSHGALAVARTNAALHHRESSVVFVDHDILANPLPPELLPPATFHLITMNPPYIPVADVPELQPEVRDHEPHLALTDDADGLTFYRRLAAIGSSLLAPGGIIMMEIGFGQSQDVTAIFSEGGYETMIIHDLASIPRVVTANLFS